MQAVAVAVGTVVLQQAQVVRVVVQLEQPMVRPEEQAQQIPGAVAVAVAELIVGLLQQPGVQVVLA